MPEVVLGVPVPDEATEECAFAVDEVVCAGIDVFAVFGLIDIPVAFCVAAWAED